MFLIQAYLVSGLFLAIALLLDKNSPYYQTNSALKQLGYLVICVLGWLPLLAMVGLAIVTGKYEK